MNGGIFSEKPLLLFSAADPFSFCPTGKDEASSVEVTWPDGKMASRNVASGEMNSVLEVPYPHDEDRLQNPAPLEVRKQSGPQSQKRGPIHKPSRMMEILAKGRYHNDPTICSLHNSTMHTALLLLTETWGY